MVEISTITSLKFDITSGWSGDGVDSAQAQLQALKAQIDDLNQQKIQIAADTAQVNADIAEVKKELSDLNTTLTINADDADAMARVEELKAELAGLQDQKLQLRVDKTQADAEIAAFKAEMDAVKDKTVKLTADTNAARTAIDSVANDMDDRTKQMQDDWQNAQKAGTAATFSIATALMALTIAMIPIGAGALAMGGAMVSAFGSAFLAAAPLAIVVKTLFTSAATLSTNMQTLNNTLAAQKAQLADLTPGSTAYNSQLHAIQQTQAQLNQTYNSATPIVQATANAITGLKTAWSDLQQATARAIQPLVLNFLSAVKTVIGALGPVINAAAAALAPFVKQLQNFVSTSNGNPGVGLEKFLDWVITNGIPNLVKFITVLENLGRTFAQIAVQFSSQGSGLMDTLVRITTEMDKWGAGGGFTRFADSVRSMMPEIKTFFEGLAAALQHVTASVYQMGPPMLSVLGIMLGLLSKMPVGVVQALIVAFGAYKVVASAAAAFFAVKTAVDAVKVAMTAAKEVMLGFTAAEAVAKDDSIALRIGSLAQAAATGIATAATAAWDVVEGIADALALPLIVVIGLLVLAVAAVGFGVYELVDHWSTAWGWIKAAFDLTWSGMKAVFDEVWGGIKSGIEDGVNFIKEHWALLLLALGPLGWLIDIGTHWKQIWDGIKSVFDGFVSGVKAGWDSFWAGVKSTFDSFINTIKGAWDSFWAGIKSTFSGWVAGMKSAWDSFVAVFVSSWNTTWDIVKTAALAVWDALKAAWQAFTGVISAVGQAMMTLLGGAWDVFWGAIKTAAMLVWDALQAAWSVFLGVIQTVWDTISAIFTGKWGQVWDDIKSVATTIWDALQDAWTTFTDFIKSAWDTISAAVQSAWTTFWNTIQSVAQGVWNTVTSGLNTFWGGIKSGFQDVVNTVGNIWNGIVTAVETPINVVIGIWDTIAGVIGLPQISKIGAAAPGPSGGNITGDATDSTAGAPKAFAGGGHILGLGGPTADKIPAMLSNGEFVMQASAVSHYGLNTMNAINSKGYASGGVVGEDGIPHFGLGGFISNVLGDVAGVASDVGSGIAGLATSAFDALKSVVATAVYDVAAPILNTAVSAIPNPIPGVPAPAGDVPHGVASTVVNAILGKLKSAQDAAKAAAAALGGTVPTGAQLTDITTALAKAGIPQADWPEWEAGLNTLISRESSWNPNAINLTDSNAAAGYPSQGLMQLIPQTFAEYNLGGTITDPVSNIVAGIRYIMATYGGIQNVQQANANLPPKGYDTGGPLPPGLTLTNNTTGQNEGVLNPTGLSAIGGLSALSALNRGDRNVLTGYSSGTPVVVSGASSGGVNMTFNLTVPTATTADPQEVVDAVMEKLIPPLTVALKKHVGTR